MTVKDLIKKLQAFPPDWKIIASIDAQSKRGNPHFVGEVLGQGQILFACENGNDSVLLSNWDPENPDE